jgi:FAD/FMN-containing dehydrogenase
VGQILLRASVPISQVPELLSLASQDGWAAAARAGDGLVYVSPPPEADEGKIKSRLSAYRETAERVGGLAVLESGPVEVKREFPVWGEPGENLDLMRELKRSFDPVGILGCGRFLPEL